MREVEGKTLELGRSGQPFYPRAIFQQGRYGVMFGHYHTEFPKLEKAVVVVEVLWGREVQGGGRLSMCPRVSGKSHLLWSSTSSTALLKVQI